MKTLLYILALSSILFANAEDIASCKKCHPTIAAEFARFLEEKEQAPIVDRCRLCYMAHNTDFKLQQELTAFTLGTWEKTTFAGEKLHLDPNLNDAASVSVILSRMPKKGVRLEYLSL